MAEGEALSENRALAGCFLRHLSAWVLAIGTPISMVFSNRSSAAVLGTATGLLLVAICLLRGPRALMPPGGMPPGVKREAPLTAWVREHQFACLFAVFLVVAAFGVPFTANPTFHGWRLLEFVTPVAFIGLMLRLMRIVRLPAAFPALVFGLMFASLLTLVELRNGAPMRGYFGLRMEDYRLNRTVVMLLILLFPLLAYACVRPDSRWMATVAAVLPLMAILQSPSGSAVLGLMAGTFIFLLALWSWRVARTLAGVVMLLCIFTAPWHGIILTDIMSEAMHERLRSTSSLIRVEIYRAFGWAVDYAPFFGSGFNTASHLEREPAFRVIPGKLSPFLEFGHAHNAALQIWVEFGLFGAALAGILALLALRRIEFAPSPLRPALLSFMVAAFAIAMVSHGAWQAWWVGALGVGLVILVSIKDDLVRATVSPERV